MKKIISGYIIERKKVKSSRWIRLNGQFCEDHTFRARRMVEGTTYHMRVVAVNEVGASDPSDVSDQFTPMAPTGPVESFKSGKCTDDSIELKWIEPEEIGAGGLDEYIIEQCQVPCETEEWKKPIIIGGKITGDKDRIQIKGLSTGKSYKFRICTVNKAGRSEWLTCNPIICAEEVLDAKINIPRVLGKKIKIIVGQTLKLHVPYQGKPKPEITWNKNDVEVDGTEKPEVKELDETRFRITSSSDYTTLYVRQTDRWDSGFYNLRVVVGNQIANARFNVAIIDTPSKPRALKVTDVVGTSAQLKWNAPQDNGNCELLVTGFAKL